MALRKADNVAKQSQTIEGVPPNFKGTLFLRVKEVQFGNSASSGRPQLVVNMEVTHPLEVKSDYDGNIYSLDSREVKSYWSLSETTKDGKPSDNLDYLINELHPLLGLPPEIDDENPNVKQYEGLEIEVLMSSVERIEQRRNPKTGSYETVKDSEGNPIKRGWQWNMIGIKDILRLVKTGNKDGRPF
jgi:hypothetical protein